MQFWIVVLGVLFSYQGVYAYPLIPNPKVTQGELCSKDNPDFEALRYLEKIPYCKRNVSFEKRQEIYDKYRIPETCRHRYTIDHFIPLAIGGDNSDSNLWPEHVLVKELRPNLELELYLGLKKGQLTQDEAIDTIIHEKMNVRDRLWDAGVEDDCDAPS